MLLRHDQPRTPSAALPRNFDKLRPNTQAYLLRLDPPRLVRSLTQVGGLRQSAKYTRRAARRAARAAAFMAKRGLV